MTVSVKCTCQAINGQHFMPAHVNIGHQFIVAITISSIPVREVIQIRAAGDNVGSLCCTAALQRIALRFAVPHIVRPLSGKRHIVRGHGVGVTCLIGVLAVAPAGEIHAVIGVRICRKGDFSACGNSFLCRSSAGCAGVAAGKGNSKFRLNCQVDGDGFHFCHTIERQHDFAGDTAGLAVVFAIAGIYLGKRIRFRPCRVNLLIGDAVGNNLQHLVCGGFVADRHCIKCGLGGDFHILQRLLSKSVCVAGGFCALRIGIVAERLDLEGVASGVCDNGSKVIACSRGRDSFALRCVIFIELHAIICCIVHVGPSGLAGYGGIPLSVGRCGQADLIDGFAQRDLAEAV